MCISFVHDFESKVCLVKNVCPSTNNTSLTIKKGLVKIKAVKIKSHRRHAKSSEPDTNNRPSSQKKVKAAAIVKTRILENQTTEITMSGYNVIGFFLLPKYVRAVYALPEISIITH